MEPGRTFKYDLGRHPLPYALGRAWSCNGVYDDTAVIDAKGRFLIDPSGVIQAMEVVSPPVGRSVVEIVTQIKAFQHVSTAGKVTPSGWQAGKVVRQPVLVGTV